MNMSRTFTYKARVFSDATFTRASDGLPTFTLISTGEGNREVRTNGRDSGRICGFFPQSVGTRRAPSVIPRQYGADERGTVTKVTTLQRRVNISDSDAGKTDRYPNGTRFLHDLHERVGTRKETTPI